MNILVAVPTFESILPETFKSIYELEVPEGCFVHFNFVRGYDCAKARNIIAKKALEFDYVLMVDSDIVVPSNALISMLSRNVDICLGVYPRKNTINGQTEVFKLDQYNFIDVYTYDELTNDCVEVRGGGLGCALIKSDVFNHISYPYFKYITYDNGASLSEDNYFCHNASLSEYKIYVDMSVKSGHVTKSIQWS